MLYAALILASVTAADISFEVENFTAQNGISEVVLKVTNHADTGARRVYISCAFLTEDLKAIDVGRALISTLGPGQTKYEKAGIPTTAGVAKAQCYVDRVTP